VLFPVVVWCLPEVGNTRSHDSVYHPVPFPSLLPLGTRLQSQQQGRVRLRRWRLRADTNFRTYFDTNFRTYFGTYDSNIPRWANTSKTTRLVSGANWLIASVTCPGDCWRWADGSQTRDFSVTWALCAVFHALGRSRLFWSGIWCGIWHLAARSGRQPRVPKKCARFDRL